MHAACPDEMKCAEQEQHVLRKPLQHRTTSSGNRATVNEQWDARENKKVRVYESTKRLIGIRALGPGVL